MGSHSVTFHPTQANTSVPETCNDSKLRGLIGRSAASERFWFKQIARNRAAFYPVQVSGTRFLSVCRLLYTRNLEKFLASSFDAISRTKNFHFAWNGNVFYSVQNTCTEKKARTIKHVRLQVGSTG